VQARVRRPLAVDAVAGGTQVAGNGADENDRCFFAHERQRRLHGEERRPYFQSDVAVEVILADLLDATEFGDARVDDEDVDSPGLCAPCLTRTSEIGQLTAEVFERFVQVTLASPGDVRVGAFGIESLGDRQADAARAANDQGASTRSS
jgi:hypothetical protein